MTEILDRRLFKAGRKLVEAGDEIHKIVLIVRGRCRIEPAGLQRSFIFGPGSLLGIRPIFQQQGKPRYPSTAIALDNVEAVFLDADDLRREFQGLPYEMKTVFQSLCIASQTLEKVYEQASQNRRKVLSELTREIEDLVKAESG